MDIGNRNGVEPKINNGRITLEYSDGDKCGDLKYSSTITLICTPGYYRKTVDVPICI